MRISDWSSDVCSSDLTGLVTLISQDLSQFALHARAILDLPIPNIRTRGPAASCAVLFEGDRKAPRYTGVAEALAEPDTQLRLFGKPEIVGKRRMAVTLALGDDIDQARAKARRAAAKVRSEEHTAELQSLMRIADAV